MVKWEPEGAIFGHQRVWAERVGRFEQPIPCSTKPFLSSLYSGPMDREMEAPSGRRENSLLNAGVCPSR